MFGQKKKKNCFLCDSLERNCGWQLQHQSVSQMYIDVCHCREESSVRSPQPSISTQQRMHQPQRHRSEETDLQPTVLGTQNQRQEELQEELRTVVVTGPSLGPDHHELGSLYFETTKRSGSGEIQEDGIRWDEKRMCFCITFQDSQGWFLLHSLKCCCHLECILCNNCLPPPRPLPPSLAGV